MAKTLAQLQTELQAAILGEESPILEDIKDSSKERREILLNVYQHAYGARLSEFLTNDYPRTLAYLGEDLFQQAAEGYYKHYPSNSPNARWFGRNFPLFLKTEAPFKDRPECAELAELEMSLNNAFDAEDTATINQSHLQAIEPENWSRLTFKPHPSTARLSQKTNAANIWSALAREETPPETSISQMPQELIIWRGNGMSRFRPLSYDEAMIWDETLKGANFSQLCEMLGTYWPSDDAPLKAATYLQSWLASELLAKAEIPDG